MYDFILVRRCNYSSILYHLRVIWRWIIPWPWNLAQRSLKVIETDAIQKQGCGFLFAFYSNYGAILYCFRDIATYLQKIAKFLYPAWIICQKQKAFSAPAGGDTVGISWRCLMLIKLEWLGSVWWKNCDSTLSRFYTMPERNVLTIKKQQRIYLYILRMTGNKAQS